MDTVKCYKVLAINEEFKENEDVVIFSKKKLHDIINEYCGKDREFRELMSFLEAESRAVVVEKKDVANLVKDYA